MSFRRAIDGAWISVPEGSYCVDGAIQSTDDESPLPHYSGDISDMAIHFCQNDFLEDDDLPLVSLHRNNFSPTKMLQMQRSNFRTGV